MSQIDDELYAEITPQLLAIACVERAAAGVTLGINARPILWCFVVSDIDQALTCQLVASLSGTMGIGALKSEHRDAHLELLNDRSETKPSRPVGKNGKPFTDRIAELEELIQRAKNSEYPFCNPAGSLSDMVEQEEADIMALHKFRNDLLHVKPTFWSLEVAGLPRMVGAATRTIAKLFEHCPKRIHLADTDVCAMEDSLGLLTEGLNELGLRSQIGGS